MHTESSDPGGSNITQVHTFDNIDGPGAPKKSRRDCRFKQEWHHGMLPSKRGPNYNYCKWCNTHTY